MSSHKTVKRVMDSESENCSDEESCQKKIRSETESYQVSVEAVAPVPAAAAVIAPSQKSSRAWNQREWDRLSGRNLTTFIVQFKDCNNEEYDAGPFLCTTDEKAYRVVINWCKAVIRKEIQNSNFSSLPHEIIAVLSTFDFEANEFTFRDIDDALVWEDAVKALSVGDCLDINVDPVKDDDEPIFSYC